MIFVFDIDCTLLVHNENESYIPQSVYKAFDLIRDSGHKIAIATGRNLTSARIIMEDLNVYDAVICDGSSIVINNEVVFEKEINEASKTIIIEEARKNNLIVLARNTDNAYMINSEDFSIIKEHAKGLILDVKSIQELTADVAINNFSCFEDYEFKNLSNVDITKWPAGSSICEAGTNKGSGIKEYLKIKGIDEEVLVFGDNLNDVEMFREFYENSYVVGNASDKVKSQAKHIIGNIEEDGIYKAVEAIINGNGGM